MARIDLGAAASGDTDLITKKVTRGWMAQCKNGEYTRTPGVVPATLVDVTDGMMYGTLIVPARNCTVDIIGFNLAAVGGTGSVVRLGIYTITFASDGAMSASLLVDAGTVATNSGTGVKTVTIGSPVDLKYGTPYMFVLASQGVPATKPDVTFVQSSHMGMSASTSAIALSTTGQFGWQVASVTGALGSTPTFVTAVSSLPLMAFHCSA